MAKLTFKMTNGSVYLKALRQRGLLTIWLDGSAIAAWSEPVQPDAEGRGRPPHYTDMAVSTRLMMKRLFNLSRRASQGFVESIFKLMAPPLRYPGYRGISKRATPVNVSFKTPCWGEIAHRVIDSRSLKVLGEDEWRVRQHGLTNTGCGTSFTWQ